MKILIFSDTHLTNKFDEKRYAFLKKIVHESDQVIINGDFWDGYIINFDEFINSRWSKLFPLLKSKRTIYLYGNHDQAKFCDERVNLFSETQQETIDIKTKKYNLKIEHGNKSLKFIDEKIPKKIIPRSFAQHALNFERFLFTNFGTVFIKRLYQKYNNVIKRKISTKMKKNQLYVCGHTHLAEIDLENNFINSGVIGYGVAQYILIINDVVYDKEYWYDKPILESMLDPYLYEDYSKTLDDNN